MDLLLCITTHLKITYSHGVLSEWLNVVIQILLETIVSGRGIHWGHCGGARLHDIFLSWYDVARIQTNNQGFGTCEMSSTCFTPVDPLSTRPNPDIKRILSMLLKGELWTHKVIDSSPPTPQRELWLGLESSIATKNFPHGKCGKFLLPLKH